MESYSKLCLLATRPLNITLLPYFNCRVWNWRVFYVSMNKYFEALHFYGCVDSYYDVIHSFTNDWCILLPKYFLHCQVVKLMKNINKHNFPSSTCLQQWINSLPNHHHSWSLLDPQWWTLSLSLTHTPHHTKSYLYIASSYNFLNARDIVCALMFEKSKCCIFAGMCPSPIFRSQSCRSDLKSWTSASGMENYIVLLGYQCC